MKHRIEDLNIIRHTNLGLLILGMGTSKVRVYNALSLRLCRYPQKRSQRVHPSRRGASKGGEAKVQFNGDKWAKK